MNTYVAVTSGLEVTPIWTEMFQRRGFVILGEGKNIAWPKFRLTALAARNNIVETVPHRATFGARLCPPLLQHINMQGITSMNIPKMIKADKNPVPCSYEI
jgi:hypothetical protein